MAVDFLHINDRLYQQSLDWLHNYINANCIVRGKLMKGKVRVRCTLGAFIFVEDFTIRVY